MDLGIALAFVVACAGVPDDPPRDPGAPRVYRVLNGDSLATIASKRSTTPELLRAWNELPPGEPPPGTILLIYPRGTTVPTAPAGTVARPLVINDPEPAAPRAVVVAEHGAPGLLGSDAQTPDIALPAPTSGPRSGPPGTPTLGTRSGLGSGPSADLSSPELQRPAPAAKTAWSAGTPARLAQPAPQPCLPPPDDAPEGEMVLPTGLSKGQIKAAMRPVAVAADACLAGEGTGTFQVTLEVVAACDGRATSVEVADAGGLPAGVGACVAEVARGAGFAAHDDPAGTVFLYPIRFTR